jgi:hypothetical protein
VKKAVKGKINENEEFECACLAYKAEKANTAKEKLAKKSRGGPVRELKSPIVETPMIPS